VQVEYGYKLRRLLLSQAPTLPDLCRQMPDTALVCKLTQQQGQGPGQQQQQQGQQQLVLRSSPVLHLRLMIRALLRHGNLQQQPQQQQGGEGAQGPSKALLRGLDSVQVPELSAAVAAAVAGSTLAVASGDGSQTAYPVVVLQQAFKRVFGFDPPINYLGVEHFKQLLLVR
jgi:hypothetical protein